jgi:2-oxoisovalerate dehydrogenase E2 component (dihydrolipoyl transacylase)
MLNMWLVEEGARVEEWDKLCEMQSDKAAVEISVNYTGMVKKLYAQPNDMVKTGAPLVDIDDGLPEDESAAAQTEEQDTPPKPSESSEEQTEVSVGEQEAEDARTQAEATVGLERQEIESSGGPSLAAPAVRGLLKEHKIDISGVKGSGQDGRILKEDVHAYLEGRSAGIRSTPPARPTVSSDSKQTETAQPLSPIQTQMFRTMTASLSIPHFLYADEVNITQLSSLRSRLKRSQAQSDPKITLLSFVLKAVSVALDKYPLLNARLDTNANSSKPQLLYRSNHNIGIAMDTPTGLLVPVVKNVAALSIVDIAREILRLSDLGQSKKLSNADLSGGTITVSNVGNIGGTVLAPVIVEGQVAILGVGKARTVPVFGEEDVIEKAEITNFSWSADHRVVDGATMARMGSMVKNLLEEPEKVMVQLR